MDDCAAERVVADGLAAGYRLIDTAFNYGNERGVGAGVRASGIPREQVFITTKFNREWHGADLVGAAFAGSADRLGVEYIDLFLIHWPNPELDRFVEAWRGLVALLDTKQVRAIGVSNFKTTHLSRLLAETGITPDVNQVQISPRLARFELVDYDTQNGIHTQSWGPLGQGRGLLELPLVTNMAMKYGCTPSQVVIAWHLARGLSVVPKSSHPERLRENLEALEVRIGLEDLCTLSALDGTETKVSDSDVFGH